MVLVQSELIVPDNVMIDETRHPQQIASGTEARSEQLQKTLDGVENLIAQLQRSLESDGRSDVLPGHSIQGLIDQLTQLTTDGKGAKPAL
jgi:hypothetical protein